MISPVKKPHLSQVTNGVPFHLIKFMINHCRSPRSAICTVHTGILSEDVMGITTLTVFKSSMAKQISLTPPKKNSALIFFFNWVTDLVGRESSGGFHLAIPVIKGLTPQIREPLWRLCQLLICLFQ